MLIRSQLLDFSLRSVYEIINYRKMNAVRLGAGMVIFIEGVKLPTAYPLLENSGDREQKQTDPLTGAHPKILAG